VAGSVGIALMVQLLPRAGRSLGHKAFKQNLARVLSDVRGRLVEGSDQRSEGEDMADVSRRLAELEERLDFVERLVAQQRDAARLGPPKS
jgi:hypothetical protein